MPPSRFPPSPTSGHSSVHCRHARYVVYVSHCHQLQTSNRTMTCIVESVDNNDMAHSKKKFWNRFRQEILDFDGRRCGRCNGAESDHVVLQVHHKRYVSGRAIWDYPTEDCETLCRGCHAREHNKIEPDSGWSYEFDDDTGSLGEECEWCGADIRYVYTISHPKWPSMQVGTDCSDRLTQTAHASNKMADRRREVARRKRFLSSVRWHALSCGGLEIRQRNCVLKIVPFGNAFALVIAGIQGNQRFGSIKEAKLRCWELLGKDFEKLRPFLLRRNLQKFRTPSDCRAG